MVMMFVNKLLIALTKGLKGPPVPRLTGIPVTGTPVIIGPPGLIVKGAPVAWVYTVLT